MPSLLKSPAIATGPGCLEASFTTASAWSLRSRSEI
jgi:hypothetical protein